MAANYYKKNKEILQTKARENYQNLSEEEKNKKREYTRNRYRKLFTENVLSEKKKMKNVNMHAIYIIIFLKKKPKKGVNIYVCEKNGNFSEKNNNNASVCSGTI